MGDPFQDVLDFMRIGHPESIRTRPQTPTPEVRDLCLTLIREEGLQETVDALETGDLVEIADGIADTIYVLVYAAHCYGIPIAEVWAEVQRTNMAKFPGGKVLRRESDGKILKPEGWTPPDIRSILGAAPPKSDSERETCDRCRGSGWLDDRGFPDVGQPAFSFQPCPECSILERTDKNGTRS